MAEKRMRAAGRTAHPRRRALRWVGATVLIGLVGGGLVWATRHPSNDRDWAPEQAVLPAVAFHGDSVTVHNVRDFRYPAAGLQIRRYEDRTYDLDALTSLWLIISPFGRRWRGPAHAFLSFGFADSQFVAISAEARRERGESYSLWRGALRGFEMMYVIGDERDLIGLRAITWNDDVFVYPIRAPPSGIRTLFIDLLRRADQLRTQPQFYNTFTNNCTTVIVRSANQIADPPIPYNWRVLLPGYADGLAKELGLLDTTLPLSAARKRFLVNGRARRYAGDPQFSLRIRSME